VPAAPVVDDRDYQQLLDDALRRIPIHNPEWTNHNRSDPGVTLLELFAFLTESLAYRANQIPDRNRRKMLELLDVPLTPASSALGIVTISNTRGPLETQTLNADIEVRAGQVPFRTELGLDVLPVEARAFFKRTMADPPPGVRERYGQLYESWTGTPPDTADLKLYETVPLDPSSGVELQGTADASLWVALLLREGDEVSEAGLRAARAALAGRVLSLGVVPELTSAQAAVLAPAGGNQGSRQLEFKLPLVPPGGLLPDDPSLRRPAYQSRTAIPSTDVLAEPGVVQIPLPDESSLGLWANLEPLETGVGEFPPSLDDTNLAPRLITWLRIQAAAGSQAQLLWVDINATTISQRTHVAGEVLPRGNGQPDQTARLARTPVLPETMRIFVTATGTTEEWTRVEDLLTAGPEVPVADPRLPPGAPAPAPRPSKVFTVDAQTGLVRFGDGTRGHRPPIEADLRADYDFGSGRAGNVGPHAINSSPVLPAGLKPDNPIRTWGGAEAETVAEGERQAARYLQNRDRLVTAFDFETITWRTPGVDIGRVDVVPAYSPELAPSPPGSAPGALTVIVVPRFDLRQPDAPVPDRLFLDTICDYLDPRRLVTTEVFLRGPTYKGIWVSVGIEAVPGRSVAVVAQDVRRRLLRFLSPLGRAPDDPAAERPAVPEAPDSPTPAPRPGWPLQKAVVALELVAEASRVDGVRLVRSIQLAEGGAAARDQIEMTGLELPRVLGISIVDGDAVALDQLRGTAPPDDAHRNVVPIPVVPESC
jgi:hypothetical protein